jgi:flagellar P-ring protein precursor FlgI
MVTAQLPPFSRAGSSLDAVVSSIGDSTSLEGGTLVMTPLFAADGDVYAIAQGAISVGGFSAGGGSGSSVQKNHPTVGRLASGATVERELEYAIEGQGTFVVALARADFTTALRMTRTSTSAPRSRRRATRERSSSSCPIVSRTRWWASWQSSSRSR